MNYFRNVIPIVKDYVPIYLIILVYLNHPYIKF